MAQPARLTGGPVPVGCCVPVACPYGRQAAGNHGDSRSLDPHTPRSPFPQLRPHGVERLPKLTARVRFPSPAPHTKRLVRALAQTRRSAFSPRAARASAAAASRAFFLFLPVRVDTRAHGVGDGLVRLGACVHRGDRQDPALPLRAEAGRLGLHRGQCCSLGPHAKRSRSRSKSLLTGHKFETLCPVSEYFSAFLPGHFTSERRRNSSPMVSGSTIQIAVVEPSMAHSLPVFVAPSKRLTWV
jgi:hypothetical protein